MSGTLFIVLASIVLVAGLAGRRRVRRARRGQTPIAADDMLRSILDEEALRALEEPDPFGDEPLDEEEIRRAEDEFWEDEGEDSEGWRG